MCKMHIKHSHTIIPSWHERWRPLQQSWSELTHIQSDMTSGKHVRFSFHLSLFLKAVQYRGPGSMLLSHVSLWCVRWLGLCSSVHRLGFLFTLLALGGVVRGEVCIQGVFLLVEWVWLFTMACRSGGELYFSKVYGMYWWPGYLWRPVVVFVLGNGSLGSWLGAVINSNSAHMHRAVARRIA
jgi:hypothetical protein